MSHVDIFDVLNSVEEAVAEMSLANASVFIKAKKEELKDHPDYAGFEIHLEACLVERICDFYPSASEKEIAALVESYF